MANGVITAADFAGQTTGTGNGLLLLNDNGFLNQLLLNVVAAGADPNNVYYGVANGDGLNPLAGSNTSGVVFSSQSAVPEPASVSLVSIGALMLARRKRQVRHLAR